MIKVGIIGFFGEGKELLNGQTIKTKVLFSELDKLIGSDNIFKVDTYGWKKNPIRLLVNSIKLMLSCNNIIILPARNGVKVFVPMYALINKLFNRKLHYIVIGGWLPDLVEDNPKIIKHLNSFDGIYVETRFMVEELKKVGIKNTILMHNFKNLNILNPQDLVPMTSEPYRLCVFSRVMKEKGIEDAIEVVRKVNKKHKREVYILDIYGPIEEKYKSKFNKIVESSPSYIKYKGVADFNESVSILKNYFVLLFPTKFKTEGIPGTIIDAYAAGLPVVATKWNSATEIIEDYKTGILYDFGDNLALEKILTEISNNPDLINVMKTNCIKRAEEYSPEKVMNEFKNFLEEV